jgi:hypothetical protein
VSDLGINERIGLSQYSTKSLEDEVFRRRAEARLADLERAVFTTHTIASGFPGGADLGDVLKVALQRGYHLVWFNEHVYSTSPYEDLGILRRLA